MTPLLTYNLLRGLHILADIAWMAGLLYLPRLFVNHVSARPGGELDTALKAMERKLYRLIMNPSMMVAWFLGLGLISFDGTTRLGWSFLTEPWALVKVSGAVLLTAYHIFLGRNVRRFASGTQTHGEKFWRAVNEIPFVLAIVMVLAVTTKWSW